MQTTYAQKNENAVQKKRKSSVSIIDSSSQSESLQRKADMANNAAQRAEAPRPNNTGMPDNLKAGIESLSGFSMDDVRVHYNSSKPATVQALAYTQGTDIHVAPGQEKHLPHEAWHVAQQMAGRVSPTTNINGMPVNDNAVLEHEADVMGEKAVQCKRPSFKLNNVTIIADVIQGLFYEKTENSYVLHQEEPLLGLYINTGEFHEGHPVYKQRILNLSKKPTKNNEKWDKEFKASGNIGDYDENDSGGPSFKYATDLYFLLENDEKKVFNDCIDSLKDLCTDEGRTSVIEGALKNAKCGSIIDFEGPNDIQQDQIIIKKIEEEIERLEEDVKRQTKGQEEIIERQKHILQVRKRILQQRKDALPRQKEMFLSRLKLMTQYIINVGDRLYGKVQIKELFFIESTGSDPHVAGQHALFLIPKDPNMNLKRVYKPHSLEFEKKFMGKEDSFLKILNDLLKKHSLEKYYFPTMEIDSKSHTEAFAERVGTQNRPIASEVFTTYMIQLGMLEIAAKKYGITDLHCENIMFVNGGPLAIDAECGGSFGIPTGIKESDAPVKTSEEILSNPSALYGNDGKQLTDRGDKTGAFAYGEWLMEQLIIEVEKDIQNSFRTQQELRFRILPFDTTTLAATLRTYNDIGPTKFTQEISSIANDFLKGLSKYKILNKVESGFVYKEAFVHNFIKAIKQGTLPAFECLIQKENIFILQDDIVIGYGHLKNDEASLDTVYSPTESGNVSTEKKWIFTDNSKETDFSSIKFDSSKEESLEQSFIRQDCGATGNNCLLRSLGIEESRYDNIRDSVIHYETEQMGTAITTRESFLSPDSLFPILTQMNLIGNVYIFNPLSNTGSGWIYWNGHDLVYMTTEPPRNDPASFIYYNGINHYERLIPQRK